MAEKTARIRELREVLSELEKLVQASRQNNGVESLSIKDLRLLFDQESALMNQAIFNGEDNHIRETCLKAVVPLIEILARS